MSIDNCVFKMYSKPKNRIKSRVCCVFETNYNSHILFVQASTSYWKSTDIRTTGNQNGGHPKLPYSEHREERLLPTWTTKKPNFTPMPTPFLWYWSIYQTWTPHAGLHKARLLWINDSHRSKKFENGIHNKFKYFWVALKTILQYARTGPIYIGWDHNKNCAKGSD